MNRLPCILTIAGSDSGGGAGIQADLKTMSMLGGYGASVITALTAQNTKTVTGIHAPSAKFVAQQLATVLDDITVDAAKTGMLFSAAIIEAVAPILAAKNFPLVVDPVCVATSGAKLLKDDAVEAMVEHMFPLADVLTPNLPEAELFAGISIKSREDVFEAAKILMAMGPKSVLIKGGHADSFAVTDWLFTSGKEPIPLMQQRVKTECTHGTGCTLSAAIATGLGQGLDLVTAIVHAQEYLNLALRAGFRVGEGGGPPNHLAPWLKERARHDVMSHVDSFSRKLTAMEGVQQMFSRRPGNVAVALPYADNRNEVAGLSGGFFPMASGRIAVVGYPEFGASLRTASVLLAARRLRPELGCAVVLSGQPPILKVLENVGVKIAWLDQSRKPDYIHVEDGGLEEWGAFEILKEHVAPETVEGMGDPGCVGREPAVYVWASDTDALMSVLQKIAESISSVRDDE
nr:bifunctional hydroxymethylpyrimidine kinase/phosphomethylpyrimidine kinase [uncultured Pseudodesulfovibrio sp.]